MSRATKALEAFIEGVPDSVLDNLPARDGTIHHDANFRLDLQSVSDFVQDIATVSDFARRQLENAVSRCRSLAEHLYRL